MYLLHNVPMWLYGAIFGGIIYTGFWYFFRWLGRPGRVFGLIVPLLATPFLASIFAVALASWFGELGPLDGLFALIGPYYLTIPSTLAGFVAWSVLELRLGKRD
jgi:hypothetical protein